MAETVVIPPPSQLLGNARATEAWSRLVNRLVEGRYGLTSDSSVADVQRAYLTSIQADLRANAARIRELLGAQFNGFDGTTIPTNDAQRGRLFNLMFNAYLGDRGPWAPRVRQDGTPYNDIPPRPDVYRTDLGSDADRQEDWRRMVERLRAGGYTISDTNSVLRSFVRSHDPTRNDTQTLEGQALTDAFWAAHEGTGGRVWHTHNGNWNHADNPLLPTAAPTTPPPRTERETTEPPPGRPGAGRTGPGPPAYGSAGEAKTRKTRTGTAGSGKPRSGRTGPRPPGYGWWEGRRLPLAHRGCGARRTKGKSARDAAVAKRRG